MLKYASTVDFLTVPPSYKLSEVAYGYSPRERQKDQEFKGSLGFMRL